jgi:hypothetical protein
MKRVVSCLALVTACVVSAEAKAEVAFGFVPYVGFGRAWSSARTAPGKNPVDLDGAVFEPHVSFHCILPGEVLGVGVLGTYTSTRQHSDDKQSTVGLGGFAAEPVVMLGLDAFFLQVHAGPSFMAVDNADGADTVSATALRLGGGLSWRFMGSSIGDMALSADLSHTEVSDVDFRTYKTDVGMTSLVFSLGFAFGPDALSF